MKHLKQFESFTRPEYINKCWKNAEIGQIVSASDIYQYVEQLHRNSDDFIDGDLGERIEKFTKFKLAKIEISKISIGDYHLDDDDMNNYIEMYKKNSNYPPIVLGEDYYGYDIIDGTHRANALNELGEKTILAYIPI